MSQPINALPDDWQVFHLGDLLDFSNGINADKSAYGSGVPFANVLEVITNESLSEVDIPGRVDVAGKVLSRYQVRRGDVLFNRTSETQDEVGLTSVYLDDKPVVFGGFVFRGRPIAEAMDINYSKYALRADYVRTQIMARGQGGIRANIGQRDLKSVTLALPPLREQRDMAEALDDASRQVKLIERSIINQQAIKQGMMQQLLTGNTRLPGFTEPWKAGALGDIADVTMGQSPAGSSYNREQAGAPLINGPTEFAAENPVAQQWTTAPVRFCKRGAVLICVRGSSTGRMNIADTAYCIERGIAAVEPRGRNSQTYIRYALATIVDDVLQLQSGSTFPSIDARAIRGAELSIPEPDEQGAIGRALHDVDGAIVTLTRRLEKAKAIKQGMMQQLLTGRTRLPVPEP